MSKNTIQRIISAFVLLSVFVAAILLGKMTSLLLFLVFGLIINHELLTNFIKKEVVSKTYILIQISYLAIFLYFGLFEYTDGLASIFINLALLVNAVFIWYLFFLPNDSKLMVRSLRKFPFLSAFISLAPIMSLVWIIQGSFAGLHISLLFLLTSSMDTGGWFFGKNFGKHKLWEKVSPRKTIEGLIGGIICSAIVGGGFMMIFGNNVSVYHFLICGLMGLLAQVGDLIQSKLKRQFEIKDSSNLIPGHGGFYDRVDSVLFLTPFYVVLAQNFFQF